jgi:hypothetical protein
MDTFPKAVIDSGPLFDALVCNYDLQRVASGRQARFESVLDDVLQSRNSQQYFLTFLASIREKLTTAHVMAELYGLEKGRLKLFGPDLHEFWRTSIDLLLQWRIEEHLVKLLDLASHASLGICLPEIGVTDTGLIDLAARYGCVLITRDARTLAREAYVRHVDCRLVRQLIPSV